MWRAFIEKHWPEHELFPGSSREALSDVGTRLGAELPEELQALLLASDGVHGPCGLGLVWPLERILADNIHFRSNVDFPDLYMPFDSLLFFGDAGNGDQFAFPLNAGRVQRSDVFAWNHEDDSRSWVASSLRQYIEWSSLGKIKL